MAWRNFQYAFLHAARDAGASAITGNNAFHADYPKDFLIDDRAGALCKFNAAATDHHIQVDRGAGTLEEIARLIVPVGHNFNGENVRVRTATDSGFTTGVVEILAETAISATTIIDLAMTGGTEAQRKQRYVRLDWPNSTSTAWEIPELVLTRTRTTTRGPEQGWGDYYRHNTLDFEKDSGVVASLVLGADRRFFELTYRNVNDSDDLDVFSDLITTCGTSKPFYVDPAFDTESAVWVKLTEDSRQVQDPAIPAATNSTQRRIELLMLEHLT
jgi:hypothetical protein